MRLRRGLFRQLVFGLIVLISCTDGRTAHEVFVDDLMQDYESSVPGASVLVIDKGVPIVRRSYGFANIETKTPVTTKTNFRLASVTKQFTAAAILLLTQDKNARLQLDDRIREKWLPTLPEATADITIRHLLVHTSGLIDYEELVTPNADPNHQVTDADVLDVLSSQNRTYFTPPGLRFSYSNSGYALLAMIVERASGQRFADFLRERIFSPLDMNETVAYERGISTVAHRAYGYSKQDQAWTQTDQSLTSAVLGDGGIYSSIDDLAKWDAALYDNQLLSSESLQLSSTPAARTDDPGNQYGMGWYISGDMVWHSGETIGFRNIILRFPQRRLTVIVLTNRNSPKPYQTALVIAHQIFSNAVCDISSTNIISASIELLACWIIIGSFYVTF